MTPREIITEEAARLRVSIDPKSTLAYNYERAQRCRQEALDDVIIFMAYRIAGPNLLGYPNPTAGADVIRGIPLSQIAPELTKREASAWIQQNEYATPIQWLAAQIRARHPEIPADGNVTSTKVWRWIDSALSDPKRHDAMLRTRNGRIGENAIEGRAIDRLDELIDEDLCRSVEDTFAAASHRMAREAWSGPDELIPEEPWHKKLPAEVTVLRKATELWIEGKECRHCVGSYADRVHRRQCIVVRVLAKNGSRSTAAVVNGRVTEHRGPCNKPPSTECETLLSQCNWQ